MSTLLAIHNFKDVNSEYNVKKYGIIVQGKIVEIPKLCGRRNNRIKVSYLSNNFSLIISRYQCISKEFNNGDLIEILYSKDENLAILPTRNVVISFYLAISFFAIPFIFLFFFLYSNVKK